VQIRLLLGDKIKLAPAKIAAEARQATQQFMALYRPDTNHNREG
jgi:hypothetical protein